MTSEAETMVERIARAIGDETVNMNMTIDALIEDGSPNADVPEILRDAARAVLTALLDPTEEMVEAGATAVAPAIMCPSFDDPVGLKDGCRQDAADSFRAMIQAALQPGSEPQ